MSLLSQAKLLTLITVMFITGVGYFALNYGFKHEFLTLFGFGLESVVILSLSLLALIKLFRQDPDKHLKFEKWIMMSLGTLSLQLALVMLFMCLFKLSKNEGPDTSFPGVVIGGLTLVLLSFVTKLKFMIASEYQSQTMELEASNSFNAIKFALTLLTVSVVKHLWPELWWVDNFAGLFLAFQVGKEGLTHVRASRRGDYQAQV